MATKALNRPLGQVADGFVGLAGTAPRSGTVTLTAINPRVSLYVRLGVVADGTSRDERKITPSTVLPVVFAFVAGEDCQVLATDDCVVTYTLTLS